MEQKFVNSETGSINPEMISYQVKNFDNQLITHYYDIIGIQ